MADNNTEYMEMQLSYTQEFDKFAKNNVVQTNKEKGQNTINSWFKTNAIIKPTYDETVVRKRLLEADDKISSLETKYARMRKSSINESIKIEKREQQSDNSTPNSSVTSKNIQFSNDSEYSYVSDVQSPSNSNDEVLSKPSTSSNSTSSLMKAPSKAMSVPSYHSQMKKLEQIRLFDKRNQTNHAAVLKVTKHGIQCEVCGVTYIDIYSLIRTDEHGQLFGNCHIGSWKHKLGMEALERSKKRQPSLLTVLNDITPTVESDVRVFRFDLTRLLLSMRVPLSVVNKEITRDFISEHVGAASKYLTDRSNLAKEYIPAVMAHHNKETFDIFHKQQMSVQVDSTYRMGEWYGFIFRCVTDELEIITRPKLKRITRALKEADGLEELSSLVIHVVRDLVDYYRLRYEGIEGAHNTACEFIKCISGDRVSINRRAFMNRNVYIAFPRMIFIDCHAHTFANCGKQIGEACEVADEFWSLHTAVFARSENHTNVWEQHAGIAMRRHNNTRWFAQRDAMEFIRVRWDVYVNFFLLPDHERCKSTSSLARLRAILCPQYWAALDEGAFNEAKQRLFNIRLELAIICEASKVYYSACYNIEGDGPLAAFTYTIVEDVRNRLSAHVLESYNECILPLVEEAVQSLGLEATEQQKNAERTRLEEYVFERINKGRLYFYSRFLHTSENAPPTVGDNNFGHLHVMFEAFALTDPGHVRMKFMDFNNNVDTMVQYIRLQLNVLLNLERIDRQLYNNVMGHIGPYLAIASHFTYGEENNKMHQKYIKYIQFWKEHRNTLTHWFALVKIALLHHPNSCGSERLFSLLKYILESEHEECLDDYICAAVYSAYNHRHDEDRVNGER